MVDGYVKITSSNQMGLFFMWNVLPVQLRHEQVFLRELTIGETMQIAKIPEAMNEARINSFLNFVTDRQDLASRLTVQERYFLLLNYLALADQRYFDGGDHSEFYLTKTNGDDFVEVDGVYVGHLYGYQATILEQKCENVYDWLLGQIALQMYGDVSKILGADEPVLWDKVDSQDLNQINEVLSIRFEQLAHLSNHQFHQLAELFYEANCQLKHLVDIRLDNEGIALSKNGGGDVYIARFRPLTALPDIIQQLAECVAG